MKDVNVAGAGIWDQNLPFVKTYADYLNGKPMDNYNVMVERLAKCRSGTGIHVLEFLLQHKSRLDPNGTRPFIWRTRRMTNMEIAKVCLNYKQYWDPPYYVYRELTSNTRNIGNQQQRVQECVDLIAEHAANDPHFEWNVPHTKEEVAKSLIRAIRAFDKHGPSLPPPNVYEKAVAAGDIGLAALIEVCGLKLRCYDGR